MPQIDPQRIRECVKCGEEFAQRIKAGKPIQYCPRCDSERKPKDKAWTPGAPRKVVKTCLRCNEEFEQTVVVGAPTRYCEPCREERKRERREQRAIHSQRVRLEDGDTYECREDGCVKRVATSIGPFSFCRQHRPETEDMHVKGCRCSKCAGVLEPIYQNMGHGLSVKVNREFVHGEAARYLADDIRKTLLTYEPAFDAMIEIQGWTLAEIQRSTAWIERQRQSEDVDEKDLRWALEQINERIRIATKLAVELGMTPRSAIAMAKDAGTLKQMQMKDAVQALEEHIAEKDND